MNPSLSSRAKKSIPPVCAAILAAGLLPAIVLAAPPARVQSGYGGGGGGRSSADTGRRSLEGQIPLRVMLVITDAVRGYKVHEGFIHLDFGGRLSKKAEKNFEETFTSVQVVAEAPADAHPPTGIDLIVSIESPHGWDKFSGFSATENLTAVFVARRPNGEEIFRVQESASEDGNRASVQDKLGDEVSRKCVQDMLLNDSVRALLSPASGAVAAAMQPKPAVADTAEMDSSGLDAPPPPPWAEPDAPVLPPAASNSGKP